MMHGPMNVNFLNCLTLKMNFKTSVTQSFTSQPSITSWTTWNFSNILWEPQILWTQMYLY